MDAQVELRMGERAGCRLGEPRTGDHHAAAGRGVRCGAPRRRLRSRRDTCRRRRRGPPRRAPKAGARGVRRGGRRRARRSSDGVGCQHGTDRPAGAFPHSGGTGSACGASRRRGSSVLPRSRTESAAPRTSFRRGRGGRGRRGAGRWAAAGPTDGSGDRISDPRTSSGMGGSSRPRRSAGATAARRSRSSSPCFVSTRSPLTLRWKSSESRPRPRKR